MLDRALVISCTRVLQTQLLTNISAWVIYLIIFGMVFGYLILGETPTYNMIIGAIIITLSGLFVIKREKEIGKIK